MKDIVERGWSRKFGSLTLDKIIVTRSIFICKTILFLKFL